jgi:hypothetical protein
MDVSAYRKNEFSVTNQYIHLNHVTYSPIPARALQTAAGYLQDLYELKS